MNIDYIAEDEVQSANFIDSKCKNCTLEELAIINELIKNPTITQKGVSNSTYYVYQSTPYDVEAIGNKN